jgi:hypothetical protein
MNNAHLYFGHACNKLLTILFRGTIQEQWLTEGIVRHSEGPCHWPIRAQKSGVRRAVGNNRAESSRAKFDDEECSEENE